MDYGFHSTEDLKRIANWNTRKIKEQKKSVKIIKRIIWWFVVIFLFLVIIETYRIEGRL